MAGPKRVGSLEVAQDLEFQQRQWKAERVGWAIMLLIALLALAGLFGNGPLSSASVEAPDGSLSATYDRFVRQEARSTLTFQVAGSQATNNEIELWVSQDYLDSVEVQRISPQPTEVLGGENLQIFVFVINDPPATLQVTFSFEAQEMGRLSGEVGVTDGPTVTFNQLSYP